MCRETGLTQEIKIFSNKILNPPSKGTRKRRINQAQSQQNKKYWSRKKILKQKNLKIEERTNETMI